MFLEKLKISEIELREHADSMHHYYNTFIKETFNSIYYNNEICEILLYQEIFLKHIDNLLNDDSFSAPDSWRQFQEFLIVKINDRIPLNKQYSSILNEKFIILFDHFESIIQD